MTNRKEWALHLAAQGFSILRCYENTKVPAQGYSWKKHMTTDPVRISEWFDAYPEMNYGVCPVGMGVILDMDKKGEQFTDEYRDGVIGLQKICDEHNDPLKSFSVETPSGGYHTYLLIDEEVGNANNFDKMETAIDVRGWAGYVIGPGCQIHSNNEIGEKYDNHGDEGFMQCPQWLSDEYLRKPGVRDKNASIPLMDWDMPVNIAKATDYLENHPPAIQGQHGDEQTYQLAAQLRDFGVSEEASLQLMFSSGWNNRCVPPWATDELENVIENAYRYAENRPGEKADFLGMALLDGIYDGLMEEVAKAEEERHNKPLFKFEDWMARGMRRSYIIPNWAPKHGMIAVNAVRGTGKSTIFLDIAMRLACDMDWQGTKMAEDYCVVYLCGEDDEGLELNTVGWVQAHPEADKDKLKDRIIFADGTPNLMSADDVKIWYQEIHKMVGDRPCAVFLDTWQRAASRAGQNKDEDMQLCVHHAEVLAESLNGPIFIAFHPPKHNVNTILGSSVVENSTSAIWQITSVAEGINVEVTRIKGSGLGNYGTFHFDQFDIDEVDEYGEKRSVIVPRKVGGTKEDATEDALAKFQKVRLILAKLVRAWMEHNMALPIDQQVPPSEYTQTKIGEGIASITRDPIIQTEYLIPLAAHGLESFARTGAIAALKQYFFSDPEKHNFKDEILKPVGFPNNTTMGLTKNRKLLEVTGTPSIEVADDEDTDI